MNSANNAVPAFTKALVGRRVAAYVLDIALLFFVLAPAEYLVQRAIGFMPQTPQAIWHMLLVNMSLPTWLYFIVSDQSARGATLGKRLVGIRVLTTAGDRLSIPRARRPHGCEASAVGSLRTQLPLPSLQTCRRWHPSR